MRHLLLVLGSMVALSCYGEQRSFGTPRPESAKVSLVRVVAAPEKLEGKSVQTRGVLGLDEPVAYLFLSTEHLKMGDLSSAVAVTFDKALAPLTPEKLKTLHGKWLIIEGKLHVSAGSELPVINGVYRLTVLSDSDG